MVAPLVAVGEKYIVTFKDKKAFRLIQESSFGIKSQPSSQRQPRTKKFMGAKVQMTLGQLGAIVIDTDDPRLLERLKSHPGIVVEEDMVIPAPQPLYHYDSRNYVPFAQVSSKEKMQIERPWGLDYVEVSVAWQTTRGEGVKVLVLDTGIDKDHPEFEKSRFIAGKNFTEPLPSDKKVPYGYFDTVGHGTHTAGTIVGGFVGVAPEAQLLVGKVCGEDYCPVSSIAAGINWGIEQKVDVINMSLGGPFYAPIVQEAIRKAEEAEIVVVAATGNAAEAEGFEDFPKIDYPSAYPTVLAVGAIDKNGQRALFSQYSRDLNIVGPGVEVNSSTPGESYHSTLSFQSENGDLLLPTKSTLSMGSGIVEEFLLAPIVFVGLGKKEDYTEDLNLESRIALVHRGEIKFIEKVNNAVAAGAAGVIIFNSEPGLITVFLQEKGTVDVPVLMIEQEVGEAIKSHINDGVVLLANIQMELGPSYVLMNGTSMSTPHVAGVAALVKAISSELRAIDVRGVLEATATPIMPILEYGSGAVNANRAVQEVIRLSKTTELAEAG